MYNSSAEGHYVEDNDQTWLYMQLLGMKAPEYPLDKHCLILNTLKKKRQP
jgi:hypothetical protein